LVEGPLVLKRCETLVRLNYGEVNIFEHGPMEGSALRRERVQRLKKAQDGKGQRDQWKVGMNRKGALVVI